MSRFKIENVHWRPPPKWPKGKRWMLGVDAANATLAMGILGVLAMLFRMPLIFPSLGATAYLLFAHPQEHQAQVRNSFFGHVIGALVGWGVFKVVVTNLSGGHVTSTLQMLQPDMAMPMATMLPYVVAAALSIGLTLAIMVGTGTEHSPACSTTLIFSLGLFQHLWQGAVLLTGVLLLLLCGRFLNRLAGFKPVSQ